MEKKTYTIRKYRPEDKEALRKVCMETSDKVFHKNERLLNAVPLIYNDYFTECEPDNVFVCADENDKASGYVICSADTKRFLKEMRKHYIPEAARQHPYMLFVAFAYIAAVLRHGKNYPAHLHIDLSHDFQHMGAGTALIDALRAHLHEKGVREVYINSMTYDTPAYKFYKKYGFEEAGKLGFGFFTMKISTRKK